MPFQSKQQMRWAFATKQPFAKRWAKMTDTKALPKYKAAAKRASAKR